MSKRETNGWAQVVAGSTAGSATVLFLHPLDVVKTRLQVQDGLGQHPQYRGTRHAVQCILQQEGWRGFYRGLLPSLLGSGFAWGAYFFVYDKLKQFYLKSHDVDRLSPSWHLLSAAQAGMSVCLVTNPIWLIKTRLQLQRGGLSPTGVASTAPQEYRGVWDAVVRIGKEEGIRGFYKGLGPSLLLQITHGAVQFMVYEELKHFAFGLRPPVDVNASIPRSPSPSHDLSPLEASACGALSKLVASLVSYPSQVIRSRLQQQTAGRSLVYLTTWQVLTVTLQREGVGGLYKGLLPNLLRTMPQSAVTFVVYESMMRMLGTQAWFRTGLS